jgi:hypothetical protein
MVSEHEKQRRLSLMVSLASRFSPRAASPPHFVSKSPEMKANCGKFGSLRFLPTQIACSVPRAVLSGHSAPRAREY